MNILLRKLFRVNLEIDRNLKFSNLAAISWNCLSFQKLELRSRTQIMMKNYDDIHERMFEKNDSISLTIVKTYHIIVSHTFHFYYQMI